MAVVYYHISYWMDAPWLFRHGYLAVDLFFCLSGFVLASAYEDRLKARMKLRAFAWRRFVRLWPLIGFGVLLGAVYEYQRAMGGASAIVSPHDPVGTAPLSYAMITLLLGTSALLIPQLTSHRLYRLNDPMWSLLFEVGINLVWAVSARWLRTWVLLTVALFASLAVAYLAKSLGGMNGGHSPETIPLGVVRVVFNFSVGLLLFRLYRTQRFRITLPAPALMIIVVAILAVPQLSNGGTIYDIAVTLFAVPVVVFLGGNQASKRDGSRFVKISGEVSYPLYVLHQPLWMLSTAALTATGVAVSLPVALTLPIAFLAASWAVLKSLDEPARQTLMRRFSN